MSSEVQKLPKELIMNIFDDVTLNNDSSTRLKMILSFPYLWTYSHSTQHMKLILNKWHKQGCFLFQQSISRPLPDTFSQEWLAKKVRDIYKRNEKPEIQIKMHNMNPCSMCGSYSFCTIL